MRKLMALLLAGVLLAPAAALSASVEDLQTEIRKLQKELENISDRVDKNERDTALDRINFSGDLRVKADTLHYQDVTLVQNPFVTGDLNNPLAFDPSKVAGFTPAGQPIFNREKFNFDNDILYTTRLRLNMKAKVWKNVDFAGRLTMYKNWGDSTGVKVFDAWNTFTMDGTNGGNTTGDWLRVERAYFDWKDIGGTPFYLSIGRRPSTYGPPSQFRENELRGGTPSGHLVHFNFDGITIGYKLGKHTGVEGQVVRFCYGQGYESEFGNGELFNEIDLEDTHLGGFNIDVVNDGTNFLQLTLFMAKDVTDGFKGLVAVPNAFLSSPGLDPAFGTVGNAFPGFNFVTRVQARENIGDILLGGIGFVREEMNGINWFVSGGWTQAKPDKNAGIFGGLLTDQLVVPTGGLADIDGDGTGDLPGFMPTGRAEDTDTKDGFSVYAGIQVPAPLGKLGLEYNWGSKYWTPFTQAQDDIVGSKLAARGHVGEAYYIFDVNPRMFIKLGAIYYDYKYSGSGAPVGEPKRIEAVQDGREFSMLPVVDKAWDGYASLTVKF